MVAGRAVERFEVNRPQVVGEVVDDEVVAINLDTGSYYSISGAGTDVWASIEGAASAEEITARLATLYDVPRDEIAAAVTQCVDELQAEGLIRPAGADAAPTDSAPIDSRRASRAPFPPPVLEKFTDMEDLLLLDPVHEVTERGWPHVEAD